MTRNGTTMRAVTKRRAAKLTAGLHRPVVKLTRPSMTKTNAGVLTTRERTTTVLAARNLLQVAWNVCTKFVMTNTPALNEVNAARAVWFVVAEMIGGMRTAVVSSAGDRTLRNRRPTSDRSTHGGSAATTHVVVKLRGDAGTTASLVTGHVTLVQPALEEFATNETANVNALSVGWIFPSRAAADVALMPTTRAQRLAGRLARVDAFEYIHSVAFCGHTVPTTSAAVTHRFTAVATIALVTHALARVQAA